MAGYTPGEQPKVANLVKLNTNENPFPPSPAALAALDSLDGTILRRYSDPVSAELRSAAAARFGLKPENVIAGNGSDDLLTMCFRCFTDSSRAVAFFHPTYSLYEELAAMQSAEVIRLDLGSGFSRPSAETMKRAAKANLLIFTRPNAPTGNSFEISWYEEIVRDFDGVVLFDEAYADFASDNCMELVKKYDNVIVMRTFSKSYSLAGLRVGLAAASEEIIRNMMKVKDSYNLDKVAQTVALAAFNDTEYLAKTVAEVKRLRQYLAEELKKRRFTMTDSETNFLFASPPDGDAAGYFEFLRKNAVLVRYFPGEATERHVRITVGTEEDIAVLLRYTDEFLSRKN